jgi:hypothetical protein
VSVLIIKLLAQLLSFDRLLKFGRLLRGRFRRRCRTLRRLSSRLEGGHCGCNGEAGNCQIYEFLLRGVLAVDLKEHDAGAHTLGLKRLRHPLFVLIKRL